MPKNSQKYAEFRTREELAQLFTFGHPTPMGRGITRSYLQEHYDGWTWNELMEVWRAAGVVSGALGGMPTCTDGVVAIHFNNPDDLMVEWADGSTTVRSPSTLNKED